MRENTEETHENMERTYKLNGSQASLIDGARVSPVYLKGRNHTRASPCYNKKEEPNFILKCSKGPSTQSLLIIKSQSLAQPL